MSSKKNILIISYLFAPNNTVGAKRASYWAKNITKQAPNIACDVISTIENINHDGINNYYCIPNTKSPKGLIKDEGITWRQEIKKWLKRTKNNYDVVVMTGSPFMYFTLTKDFKNLGSKIILDYRDPFANNPRFNNTKIKIKIKTFYERKFNSIADKIISINPFCLSLLSNYKKSTTKFKVIKNGYEEIIINDKNILSKKAINLIYTGTFYPHITPKHFLKIINRNSGIRLHHLGQPSHFTKKFEMKNYGLKSYKEMIKGIDEADIGIIFSSGLEFESTTKVYDYIYRKKPIWVISNQEIKSGGIWEELKNYPAVIWSLNTEESITTDLPKILHLINKKIDFDTTPYSRKEGLMQLINLIEELC